MVRFFVSLIWLIVILGVDIFAFVLAQPIIGAGAEFLIAIITFLIPYLRKKGTLTRWWGWLALFSALSLAATAFSMGG